MVSIGSLVDAFNNTVTDYTINGECSGCGSCCSNILVLSEQEIETIKRYIKRHHIKEQKHSIPANSAKVMDLTCPFLNLGKKDKCVIYKVRPMICRCFKCNEKHVIHGELFLEPRKPVDVRDTFFGDKKCYK